MDLMKIVRENLISNLDALTDKLIFIDKFPEAAKGSSILMTEMTPTFQKNSFDLQPMPYQERSIMFYVRFDDVEIARRFSYGIYDHFRNTRTIGERVRNINVKSPTFVGENEGGVLIYHLEMKCIFRNE